MNELIQSIHTVLISEQGLSGALLSSGHFPHPKLALARVFEPATFQSRALSSAIIKPNIHTAAKELIHAYTLFQSPLLLHSGRVGVCWSLSKLSWREGQGYTLDTLSSLLQSHVEKQRTIRMRASEPLEKVCLREKRQRCKMLHRKHRKSSLSGVKRRK